MLNIDDQLKKDAIIIAALELLAFSKKNKFPIEGTSQFFIFTNIVHELEISFIRVGFDTNFSNDKKSS